IRAARSGIFSFGGNPFVTAVAIASFTTVLDEKIPERAARIGRYLMEGLRRMATTRPVIRAVRGRGLLIGAELSAAAGPIVDACREDGVLILSAGEKVVRMAPPL